MNPLARGERKLLSFPSLQQEIAYPPQEQSFRPRCGRVHFFWSAPKETEPKKNAPTTTQSHHITAIAIFQLAIHGSVENTAHPWAAPDGSGRVDSSSFLLQQQQQQQQQSATSCAPTGQRESVISYC